MHGNVKRDKLCFNCLSWHKVAMCMYVLKARFVNTNIDHNSMCTSHTNTKADNKDTGQTTTTTDLFIPTISVSNSPLLQAAPLLKTAI